MNGFTRFANLAVMGYMGRVEFERWPMRLLPVFKERTSEIGLAPPFEESGESIRGVHLEPSRLADAVDEGEITLIDEGFSARPNHWLVLLEEGIRYMPSSVGEQRLGDVCISALEKALDQGIDCIESREWLFRCLRARETPVGHALLAVHFQSLDAGDSAAPEREDLKRFIHIAPMAMETKLVNILRERRISRNILWAFTEELKRAGRDEFVNELRANMPAPLAKAHSLDHASTPDGSAGAPPYLAPYPSMKDFHPQVRKYSMPSRKQRVDHPRAA